MKNWRMVCRGSTCGTEIAFVRGIRKKDGAEISVPVNADSLSDGDVADLEAGVDVKFRNGDHIRHHPVCPNVGEFRR